MVIKKLHCASKSEKTKESHVWKKESMYLDRLMVSVHTPGLSTKLHDKPIEA